MTIMIDGTAGISGFSGPTQTILTSGSGGGGGGTNTTSTSARGGSGGGAGAYVEAIILSPANSYLYTIGAAGSGGGAGTSGNAGGQGAAGIIIVEEHYSL